MSSPRFTVSRSLPGKRWFIGRNAGKAVNSGFVVHDALRDEELFVMRLSDDDANSIYAVLNMSDLEKAQLCTWTVVGASYVYNTDGNALHRWLRPTTDDKWVELKSRCMFDVRRVNMNIVPRENRTHASVDPLKVVPEELYNALDFRALPKFVFFDATSSRYSFLGHPYIKELAGAGVDVPFFSTSSTKCSIAEKLTDVMAKYTDMYERHAQLFPHKALEEEAAAADRKERLLEFRDIIGVVHAYEPEPKTIKVPVINLDELLPEGVKARALLAAVSSKCGFNMLSLPKIGGSKHLAFKDIIIAEMDVVVRLKGKHATVFDMKYADAIKDVNFESEDFRIPVTPAVRTAFPDLPTDVKRIKVHEFVYAVLGGNVIPEGWLVGCYNMIRFDLREANLILLKDNGAGQRTPKDTRLDASIVGDLGMTYTPRNMTLAKGSTCYSFAVKCKDDKVKKFAFSSPATAPEVFVDKVLPFMRAEDAEFDMNNEKFQRLSAEYGMAKAIALELNGN